MPGDDVKPDVDDDFLRRGLIAQRKAAQAVGRLLALAEQHEGGQVRCVVHFLASTCNGEDFPWDPFKLREVDIAVSDDMLLCLDALRWAGAPLHELVPDGQRRILKVMQRWILQWPDF